MALITRSNPRCFTLLLVYAIDLPNTDDRINVSQSSSPISGEGIDLCWEGWICLLLLGGTTSVSSATDKEKSDRIISSSSVLDFHVVSKVSVVDTEVDPPQQNSRPLGSE